MDAPAFPARDGARPLALVVEGDAIQRIGTVDCVAEAGFEVIEAWNGTTALRQIERHPELCFIVIDADLPDPDGRFALIHAVARLRPGLTLMAVSAGPAPEPGALPCDARFSAKPLGAVLARQVWAGLA
ncbi:response regulator [Methylorubrum sp. SB2]|uniref:response regulator n=1 Tax=Methylorubrum subtropicum TaxID=3138812 RepID=UPI00313C1B86